MKKVALAGVVLLVIAASIVTIKLVNKTSKPTPKNPQKTTIESKPQPVKEPSVVVPEPTVTSGYVVGVVSVSKSTNGEVIGLKVVNDSDEVLLLDPDAQFKLVGLTSSETRAPIAGKTTAGFKGSLIKNAELSGSIFFDAFTEEQSELRFFPDINQPTYIMIPLIPLPSGT